MSLPSSAAATGASSDLASIRTLPELLERRIGATPSGEGYRSFDPATGVWASLSWQAFGEEVRRRRLALKAEGVEPGARIAILLPSGVEHVAIDQAALAEGLVPVPMHALDNAESIAYILRDCGAALLFVDSVERWRTILKSGDVGPQLRRVIVSTGEPGAEAPDARVIAFDEWISSGTCEAKPEGAVPIDPNDLAAVVYTSGTTGRPKGGSCPCRTRLSAPAATIIRS